MNNTKTTIAAIFIAATLVVAGTLAATTTPAAFAYQKKKKGEENSKNGNTITAQINKQKAYQSGWDNVQTQDAENVICTHPASGATCKALVSNQTGGGGGDGGGGACSSPLVEVHVGSPTGDVLCVAQSDLHNPNNGGQCGSDIDVFVDSIHKCLIRPG
jgi:type II secretory pathway pseudopilin PulG